MDHKRRLLFFIFLFLNVIIKINSTAQSPGDFPKITPPSPVAANFTIYGDYPVSYNTGIPDIQIPLYTIKCGDIEVPISLKYHIGSAKPNPYSEEMSNIGYGWMLDAGGLISRTVYGKQDESDGLLNIGYRSSYNQDNFDDYYELRDISVGQLDSEYDIFNYAFDQGSGKFVIFKSTSGTYKVSSFPYKPWKWDFTFSGSGSSKLISSVIIKNDKGNKYSFSATESNQFANSGWFLTRIESANNRLVDFTYVDRHIYSPSSSYYSYRYDVTDYHLGHNILGDLCDPTLPNLPIIVQNYSTGAVGYDTKTIKEITFDLGKVVFDLTNNTLINNFIVFDKDNLPIRKVVFYRSYFQGQSAYNRLDSIQIQDGSLNTIQVYKFDYNPNSVLNSRYTDYWGWYNGVSNTNYVPYTEISYYFSTVQWTLLSPTTRYVGDLNRCVDPTMILAQTLKRIHYPTGGYTDFLFEPNQFNGTSPCNNNSLGDGLRIKSITNVDNGIITSRKTYVYQPGTNPRGRFDPSNYYYWSYNIEGYTTDSYNCTPRTVLTFSRTRSYQENLISNIIDNSIRYSVVEEYNGTQTSNNGKTIYYYSYNNDHIYEYYTDDAVTPQDHILLIENYLNWGNGLLNKVETYNNIGPSSYSKIKEKTIDYKLFNDTSFHSLRVFELTHYPNYIQIGGGSYQGHEVPVAIRNYSPIIPTPPVYGVYDYEIHTGGYVQTKTIEKDFFPEQVTKTTSNYFENGYKKYLTKSLSDSGTVNMVTTYFKYPYDFTDSVYNTMVSLNKIDYLVEEIKSINGSTDKVKYAYKDWGNGIISPEYVKTSQNTSNYDDRFVYYGYDVRGNILSAGKPNDYSTCLLWGYNKLYPLAEIKFATQSEILSINPDISQLELGSASERQRIYSGLPNSIITFFTYKPHIGLTSQTDPTGVTTYYEYDSFGRLKLIRDNDNRILKTYSYQYK